MIIFPAWRTGRRHSCRGVENFFWTSSGPLEEINPQVSLPYWDWTVDREPTASLWADDFLGGNGDRREDYMVKTGPFAHASANCTTRCTNGSLEHAADDVSQ